MLTRHLAVRTIAGFWQFATTKCRPMYDHFGILLALMVPTLDMRAMPPVHFVPIIGLTATYRLPLLMKPTTYIPSFNPLVISLVQIAANLFLYLC